jgi:hypothetical protein
MHSTNTCVIDACRAEYTMFRWAASMTAKLRYADLENGPNGVIEVDHK